VASASPIMAKSWKSFCA